MIELHPSRGMWQYMSRVNGKITENNEAITPLQVASALADKMYGYHISYSATELIKDLGLVSKKGNVNKLGKQVVALYLHCKYHGNGSGVGVKIVNPEEEI